MNPVDLLRYQTEQLPWRELPACVMAPLILKAHALIHEHMTALTAAQVGDGFRKLATRTAAVNKDIRQSLDEGKEPRAVISQKIECLLRQSGTQATTRAIICALEKIKEGEVTPRSIANGLGKLSFAALNFDYEFQELLLECSRPVMA